jgi:hypothetical protein
MRWKTKTVVGLPKLPSLAVTATAITFTAVTITEVTCTAVTLQQQL